MKQTAPALTAKHRKMHVDWIKKKITWTKEKWETMVFSNEKKFNLDGPDSSMNDREEWRERVRDIRAASTI